jgi:acetoin utilization protein AcuB
MSREFITLSPDDKVDRAIFLFHYEKIHHLPVVTDDGQLVGILAQYDVRKVEAGPRRRVHETQDGRRLTVSNRKVRTVMRRQPYTIGPEDSVEKAATLMANEQIGSLPVIDGNGALVGIITSTHLLGAFARLFRFIPDSIIAEERQAAEVLETNC